MNKNQETTVQQLSPTETARLLAMALGETEKKWITRLENWRRGSKPRTLQWCANEVGRPVYLAQNVQDYIAAQQQVRKGILTTDKHLRARVTAVCDSDEGDGQAFVRLVWSSGDAKGLISLSITSASVLVKNLQAAINRAEFKTQTTQQHKEADNQG